MFVDRIKIHARAGDGGNGCVSFRREKFVPKGGPDGGDGGKGGDIILETDVHTDNLVDFFYRPLLRAKSGQHGMGKDMYGKAAKNSAFKVPLGTVVYRYSAATAKVSESEAEQPNDPAGTVLANQEVLADLSEPGQRFVLCRGGAGGKGNTHFKSSRNRVPRQFTEGEPGQEGEFLLELRMIADVGLVGYPNAGKSTLLGKLSAARPKVAPYPFTTLNPIVGVVEFDGYQRLTVADIPGLIEGAHRNVGLGHDFLRHIVRCKLFVFVLDTAGSEGRNPINDLQTLRRELDLYDPTLSRRPWLIAANKMDIPEAGDNLKSLQQRFTDRQIVPISAKENEGIEALKGSFEQFLLQPESTESEG
ncbi:MAG TPA: GTPase ObgE [Chthoniobacterales bacterium]|nr:GTPase ObgE [Chthoniobacterales bacterium]